MDEFRTDQQLVVLGDVVDSRDIAEREAFRLDLKRTLERINDEYGDEIRAPFQILKGIDEFGGVLADISVLYEVVKQIYFGVYPVRIRFASVLGRIDVGTDENTVSEMDGPAFHEADNILTRIEAKNRLFRLDTGNDFFDVPMSNNVNLNFMLVNSWTPKEVEIVRLYENLGTQTKVAEELDVTQQRVSNALQDTNWPMFHDMETDLNDVLELYSSFLSHEQ